MKKIIIILGAMMLFTYGHAFAYMMDGNLGDWGITRYAYNGGSKYWISNWQPADADIDRAVQNNLHGNGSGGAPWGGEPYDVEALYFDDDQDYLYFAMITSFPMTGRNGVTAGDLAIDFSGAPADDYKYGIKIRGLTDAQYGLNSRELRVDPTWYFNGHDQGPIQMTAFGTPGGLVDVYYWNAQAGGYLDEPGTDVETWIIEGRIDRSLFSPFPQKGDSIKLHWAMTCGNDYIDLNGDFDAPPVPEPTTLSLLGLGLFGLLGLRKRRQNAI